MGQGVLPETGGTSGVMLGELRWGSRPEFAAPAPPPPLPIEVTGQDLRQDKGDQSTPQIPPPLPTPLSPTGPQQDGKGTGGLGA